LRAGVSARTFTGAGAFRAPLDGKNVLRTASVTGTFRFGRRMSRENSGIKPPLRERNSREMAASRQGRYKFRRQ
jgi:hypothetical protein